MASIFLLPEDVFMHILQYLDTNDRIAFAFTCQRFKQICTEETTVMRKVDLSRHAVRRNKRCAIKEFFRDKQMAQNIKELNLSNHHVFNWEMDIHLQQFITCCPQLEALHVLNCPMSLKTLHGILQHASKLTTLSFSIMNLSGEDVEFICTNSVDNMCLQNIRNLHVEIPLTTTHLQMLKYLLLSSSFKFLEELEIFIWKSSFLSFKRELAQDIIFFFREMSPPVTGPLQYFHSLKVISMSDSHYYDSMSYNLISDFITSIAEKKSCETKWKKLWISPPIDSILQENYNLDEFDSLEEFSLDDLVNAESEVKTLFQRINDNAVRKLQLADVQFFNHFSESVARIGGDALQCLIVSHDLHFHEEDLEAKIAFDTVFSVCPNITELNLVCCHFTENICKTLSKLKHLVKIQVSQCAIVPEHDEMAQQIADSSLSSLVESCRNVTGFHVYGCRNSQCQRFLTKDDLMPVAKWTKLGSFVCVDVTLANQDDNQDAAEMEPTEQANTFLKEIVENCKFLMTLSIAIEGYVNESYFTFLESARSLKHLAIIIPDANLRLKGFWQLLSCATNLERLCITSEYKGLVHIDGAVEMIKSLLQLQVLHLHLNMAKNIRMLMKGIDKALEEEGSGRYSSFEFFVTEDEVLPRNEWIFSKGVLPMNRWGLCSMIPSLDIPGI